MIEGLILGTTHIFQIKEDNSSSYAQIMPLDSDAIVHYMNNQTPQPDLSKVKIREAESFKNISSFDTLETSFTLVTAIDAEDLRYGDELQVLTALDEIINTFKVAGFNSGTGVVTGRFNNYKKGLDGKVPAKIRLRQDDRLIGMYPETFALDQFKVLICKSQSDVDLQIKVLVGGNGGV